MTNRLPIDGFRILFCFELRASIFTIDAMKYRVCTSWSMQWKSLETFISKTNDGIFTKKISRVKEHMLKLWWKFHPNSVVSYGDKNFQTFSLKSQTGSFVFPIFGITAQNHFLSIIPFLRRSGVKKTYRNEIKKILSCELIVKFQNWTCFWDSTNFKMDIIDLFPIAWYPH
jgi:hypothetical protein